MTTLEALRAMLDASGVSAYRAALDIGRAPTCVSGMLRRGSCPNADLLAKIADACGYDLALLPRDGGACIRIDGAP